MKNFVFIFEEELLFTRNQVFCLKGSKVSKRSYSAGFIIFLWDFTHKCFLGMLTKKCEENRIFSEWFDLKKTVKRPLFYMLQET